MGEEEEEESRDRPACGSGSAHACHFFTPEGWSRELRYQGVWALWGQVPHWTYLFVTLIQTVSHGAELHTYQAFVSSWSGPSCPLLKGEIPPRHP